VLTRLSERNGRGVTAPHWRDLIPAMHNSASVHVPFPDLRILSTQQLHPHEQHDSQRSSPLIENLRASEYLSNPPIVTLMESDSEEDEEQYVVLDGANRWFAFETLGYPHILAQVVSYDDPHVSLGVWNHVISDLPLSELVSSIQQIADIEVVEAQRDGANRTPPLARLLTLDHRRYVITTQSDDVQGRNSRLSDVVAIYQRSAVLHRTTIREPHEVLPLYPQASALMIFPPLQPEDILRAARDGVYLPPGISRHIVQGRAIQVNFPLLILRDEQSTLADKNELLRQWIQHKLSSRQVRYYAEATYQFDE
jgi:hypothetical protein